MADPVSIASVEPLPADSPDLLPDKMVTEKSISCSWRISVSQLAAMRHAKLRRQYHWDIVNYTVCYTPEGVERLKDLMTEGVAKGEVKVTVKEDIPAEVKAKGRWKVVRIPPNPRMVLIQNEWSLENVWMYVRTNRNFKKNLVVHDEDLSKPDALGRRILVGKHPRFYGRW